MFSSTCSGVRDILTSTVFFTSFTALTMKSTACPGIATLSPTLGVRFFVIISLNPHLVALIASINMRDEFGKLGSVRRLAHSGFFVIDLTVRHVGRPARATAARTMLHSTTIRRGLRDWLGRLNQGPSHRLWLAKTVSDVAVSQNVSWVGSVVLQFLADLTDENANIRAFVSKARTTQSAKQASMRNRPACVRHQQMNSVKFARRQVHLDPSSFDAPTGGCILRLSWAESSAAGM
jgi:hypothetical protein